MCIRDRANGKEVKLPQIVSVGLEPTYGVSLSMPGSVIMGNLTNSTNSPINNTSFELIDSDSNGDVIIITTNESGGYKYGPLSSGDYNYQIDLDGDNLYEQSGVISVGEESEIFEPLSLIPETYDIEIQLVSPIDENGTEIIDISEVNVTISSVSGYSEIYSSNDTGVLYAELPVGNYKIEQSAQSDYLLFTSIDVIDMDLSFDQEYSVATEVTGTILAYLAEFDANWTEEQIIDNTTQASVIDVILQSGEYDFKTITDSEGNFSVTLPGELNYVLKSSTTTLTYGVGLAVDPSVESNLGDIYLKPLSTLTGQLYVNDDNTTWNSESVSYTHLTLPTKA